jgi:phosphatidylserine/phosphatidylglycerophosphate/cardiolipin synthase-like enzyme
MSHSLVVLPDDSAKPLVDAINAAKRTLQIRMFLFTDPTMLQTVLAAKKRGVHVRVMLNPARRDGTSDNGETRVALEAAKIEVHDSNPEFALTHQKSMVIDEKTGFVESLNWEIRDLTETRDYAVTTEHGHEVKEMIACFDADWAREKFVPRGESQLIWCPDNGRERIAEFIESAKHTLWLQNERYQDTVIIERLVRAARRGVKIHILARPPHTLKKDKLIEGVGGLRIMHDVGAKVHTLKGLKLHAKMIVADHKRAVVGSINLAPGVSTRAASSPSRPMPTMSSAGSRRSRNGLGQLEEDRSHRRGTAQRSREAQCGGRGCGDARAQDAREGQGQALTAPAFPELLLREVRR